MSRKSFSFENVELVSGVSADAVPEESFFAGKSQLFHADSMPWNLEEFTGPEAGAKRLLLRTDVTVPEDGVYVLGASADYFLKIWVDGELVMDREGHWFPSAEDDHIELVQLKKGKHVVGINFGRGSLCAKIDMGLYRLKDFPQFGDGHCSVDLTRKNGHLRKELHGSNTTVSLAHRAIKKYDEKLKALNFTYARTHDWALWNQGQRIIDTHFIFPLMRHDPADPENYFFDATDEIIRLTQEKANLKVFYRLGTSIEYTEGRHFNINPPADAEKYAEVLAGIVRHYTKGWANGFHYDIKYWEIWNEPNGREVMWAAPLDTFTPFFVTVLKRLKKEFPELCFGGPAFNGVGIESFLPILEACRKEGIAPDFISWHCYTSDPGYLIRQPGRMRRSLDELGFTETKLCIDEWHYLESWEGVISASITPEQFRTAVVDGPCTMQGINSGVMNLAVLSGWQQSPLDLGMWYGNGWEGNFGYKNIFKEYSKNYWSMCLFGQFLRDYTVMCSSTYTANTFSLAACSEDGAKAGVLIADYKGKEKVLHIPVRGAEAYSKITAVILDNTRNNEPVSVTLKDGVLVLNKAQEGSAAFLVMLEK